MLRRMSSMEEPREYVETSDMGHTSFWDDVCSAFEERKNYAFSLSDESASRSCFALVFLTFASACVLLTLTTVEVGSFVVDIGSESSKGPGIGSVLISGPGTGLAFEVVVSIGSENFVVFPGGVSGSRGVSFGYRIVCASSMSFCVINTIESQILCLTESSSPCENHLGFWTGISGLMEDMFQEAK